VHDDTAERGRPGAATRPTLARLLPIDTEKFSTDYWGRAPLLASSSELDRASRGKLTDLLTLADVDEIVSRRGLRTPFIRVAKAGTVVDPRRYTASGGAGAEIGDQVADEKILRLFADGSTIVLQALHRFWPPLIDFGSALAADLGHPVQVNAYITPASSQGFAAHYDVHDVFVVQVHGAKRWRIHPPVIEAPLRTQPWSNHAAAVAARAAEPALIDTVLRPGDVLYLPRGYLHSAVALGDVSAHLTVGVHPVTRYAIVEVLAKLVADDPQLRSSLPLGLDVTAADSLAGELTDTVEQLITRLRRVEIGEVEPLLTDRLLPAAKAAPISPIAQAAAAHGLHSSDVVMLRPQLRYTVECGDRVTVRMAHQTLDLPVATEPAIRALLTGRPCRVDELPGLDDADALVLVRRLLQEAVVVPTPPSE
jgi:lysine-specific demethylase/histidyl-hydroxylase NO66